MYTENQDKITAISSVFVYFLSIVEQTMNQKFMFTMVNVFCVCVCVCICVCVCGVCVCMCACTCFLALFLNDQREFKLYKAYH